MSACIVHAIPACIMTYYWIENVTNKQQQQQPKTNKTYRTSKAYKTKTKNQDHHGTIKNNLSNLLAALYCNCMAWGPISVGLPKNKQANKNKTIPKNKQANKNKTTLISLLSCMYNSYSFLWFFYVIGRRHLISINWNASSTVLAPSVWFLWRELQRPAHEVHPNHASSHLCTWCIWKACHTLQHKNQLIFIHVPCLYSLIVASPILLYFNTCNIIFNILSSNILFVTNLLIIIPK